MSLITPGKYDFSFNQDYLMAKLYSLDIYSAIFYGLWFSVFCTVVVYLIFRAIQRKKIEEDEIKQQRIEARKHEIFHEFHEICRLIYEDENVFKRPSSMIEKMYHPRLHEVIVEMGKEVKMMNKHYRYLIPDYDFYRKKLIESENNNGTN